MRRESKLKCCRGNNEIVCQQLLQLSNYGSSRHTVTKYLSDEKTHGAINTNLFKRLDYINDQLYEVELIQSLLGSSYSNTLDLECWSFTITFLREFVTSTNLGS